MLKQSEKIKSVILNILLALNIIFTIFILGNYILNCVVLEKEKRELNSGKIWADTYTPLKEFEYYIEGNEIYIREYIGNDYRIALPDSYKIGKKEYHVVSIDKPYSIFKNARSVIIPDGTITLGNTHYEPYGGSETMFLYIPKSLKRIRGNFWNSFMNLKKIYYGGTDDQWKKLIIGTELPPDVEVELNIKTNELK
ncbi:MAG: hypothetical protein MSA90_03270 [Faecalicatena sp.]|uniref:hypothetical protein n=1 Tax=Faecalicatena sp. TaxID=2005360 RepID=UPI00258A6FB9|nr:hypothetical protein [Faecalicatena sp.]MCI6464479.1 hypothetical protein [Faecalicatena sp.]MDY5619041.1 hypothetical protein [Lachnospiraceae bacterium]